MLIGNMQWKFTDICRWQCLNYVFKYHFNLLIFTKNCTRAFVNFFTHNLNRRIYSVLHFPIFWFESFLVLDYCCFRRRFPTFIYSINLVFLLISTTWQQIPCRITSSEIFFIETSHAFILYSTCEQDWLPLHTCRFYLMSMLHNRYVFYITKI